MQQKYNEVLYSRDAINDITKEEFYDKKSNAFKTIKTILLNNGMSLELTEIDEPEIAVSNSNASKKREFIHSSDTYPTKKYGNRKYTSSHKFGGGVYPTGYAKLTIGYTLNRNKRLTEDI